MPELVTALLYLQKLVMSQTQFVYVFRHQQMLENKYIFYTIQFIVIMFFFFFYHLDNLEIVFLIYR